jgi:hypothetical protein
MKLVNSQEINLMGISSINITYQSEDVTFYQSDSDKLIFKEYMNYTPDTDELSLIDKNGSELTFQGRRDCSDLFTCGLCPEAAELKSICPPGITVLFP